MILSNKKNAKFESPFSLKILDENYNLVTPIKYDNVQWDRMFQEVGKFVIEGVIGNYDKNTWKYVYTEKRKELGIISQVNLKKDEHSKVLTLSGLFTECDLNNMICYAKPTNFDDDPGVHYGTSVLSSGSPTWITSEGTADQVALAFFNGFKQISFRNYFVGDFEGTTIETSTFALDIELGEVEPGEYKYSIHNRNNEKLGNKLYDILKESYASPEVTLDFQNRQKIFNIIHGKNKTQTGYAPDDNPVTFSMANGSIKSASIVTSNTGTRDAEIQYSISDDQTLILINALPNATGRFVAESMSSSQSDFINSETPGSAEQDKKHKLSVMADAATRLNELKDVVNIQFDFVKSSYRYMEDYDLGDIVSIDIPEIGISVDAQIVACHEVIRSGVWSMSIEVGQTILRKRGKY